MRHLCVAVAVVACLALPAGARADGSGQQAPRPAGMSPGVVVEPIENGLVLGPDVKITRVNGRDATLVGGYGGVLLDRSVLIGAAGYWLSNGDRRLEMAYGGALVEWYLLSRRTIDVSIRGLVGAGTARVAHSWNGRLTGDVVTFGHRGTRAYAAGASAAGTAPAYLVYESEFLVGEPQLNIAWHAARWVTLSAGVSYRAIGDANGLERDLRGAAGGVSIRFGGRR